MRHKFLFLTFALLSFTLSAQEINVVDANGDGYFPLVTTSVRAPLVYDRSDGEVVYTALSCLASDIKAVTRRTPVVTGSLTKGTKPVIVGTVGQSALVDSLVRMGKIDASAIVGKWEAFGMEVVNAPFEGVEQALVLYGSQPRGTAYAIFELSRRMGVSPWIWWADVAPAGRTALYVTPGRFVRGEPSVKFRGIFLNDEDFCLRPWAAKTQDTNLNNFGPVTYVRIMELLLRLRANTLWPAMHAGSRAFWFEKSNLPLIHKYDIYMGSSHCEQMLRDNVYEWTKFGGTGESDWNYATNKSMVQRYWADRVGESRGYNAIYTLGMRGVHDTGINGYSSTEDKVRGLTEILAYQRQLITDSLGDQMTIPQVFIPYKEVLTAYNAGLRVPDDVTLMWVDDNQGYIRQFPTATEQRRSGGHGVYYHLSYWGSPGNGWLWLSTVSPTLCCLELKKAYEQGIRNQWIINVGDIKPAEEELEFCMDLAWDVDKWNPQDAYLYTREWAARTFGESVADEISAIKLEYYRLGIAAKPEHVQLVGFDWDEVQIEKRLDDYRRIYDRAVALKASIPTALRDAYYQLVEYPVRAAADQNIKLLRARQSFTYARAGRQKAVEYATEAQNAFNEIVSLTNTYNTGISGGKWNRMMDYKPNNWSQHLMPSVATQNDVVPQVWSLPEWNYQVIAGGDYETSSSTVVRIEGLGAEGSSATVWPLNLTAYTNASYIRAPYVTYSLGVRKGLNEVEVRLLPTFPLNASYDLRVGISTGTGVPTFVSAKTSAMSEQWDETVSQGYFPCSVFYESDEDKTIQVKLYLMDPCVVIAGVAAMPLYAEGDETENLLVNSDFEYSNAGRLNPQGTSTRYMPKGWQYSGTLKGNSWGVNQDAKHIHGINACWVSSAPMPDAFELYQTVPASKLKPGTYRVSCLLGAYKDKLANCRLFANNSVQYYGKETDYVPDVIVKGEDITYAGYGGSGGGRMNLNPMQVLVTLAEGEDLRVGIRSSNFKTDGTRSTSDNHGWFKVDHFRIERLADPEPQADTLGLTRRLVKNYDFEFYEDTLTSLPVPFDGVTHKTLRAPYGWQHVWNGAQPFPGTSYGINTDGQDFHGQGLCWYQPQGDYMPEGFELFQEIPADSLVAGTYEVRCLLWLENKYFGTTRLFANNAVQYFGPEETYALAALTEGETATFAGHATQGTRLCEMVVRTHVGEGENLRLGLRSGRMATDGLDASESKAVGVMRTKNGWFRCDYFRLSLVEADGTGVNSVLLPQPRRDIFMLDGRRVERRNAPLPRGIYIMDGRKVVMM